MEPTDNFSQKKKKDLVAIATLFGILTEEKANRMSKPELIVFLQEQDQKSRSSSPKIQVSPILTTDAALLQATGLMLEAIKDSNVIAKLEKGASVPVKSSELKRKKIPAADLSESEPKKIPAADLSESEPKKTVEISDMMQTDIYEVLPDEEKPDQKKRRGRPKKASDNTISDTVAPDTVTSNNVTPDTVTPDNVTPDNVAPDNVTPDNVTKKKFVSAVKTKELFSEDQQKETAFVPVLLQDDAGVQSEPGFQEDIESIEEQTFEYGYSDQPEKWNQQPAVSDKAAAAKLKVSREKAAVAKAGNQNAVSSAADSHAAVRPRRHSVIIKPKEEEFSDAENSAEYSGQSNDDDQESLPRQDESETAGPAARSGEHSEFGSHHVKTLRPKEQQQEMLSGVLELMSEGYGFLRRENYLQGQNDIYVPAQYVRRFGLRLGDFIVGPCRPKRESDRYQALQYIKEVNGMPPEKMIRRVHFDRLTPVYPDEKYILETDKNELSTRIIDLVAPIGKGQRGMIVSPPKAGKTILLQKIANAISINNPDSKLIVLLIDERPEEVTDMQRSINGEVVYSTFDKTPENHVRIVELVLERAMRLVELGQDVVILLDSITRLSRAYNLTINPTGRTLSGGLDPGALYGPKRFFGAARNIEGGGSLTIVATSLIDTGSRMDEVIFEEFKGTGNMEVYLDRKLSEKRIFPAIDINKSGTRHEELLLPPVELDAVWTIRKAFGQLDTSAVTEMIISLLMKTANNNQFVQSINVSFNDKATFDAMRGTRPAGNSTNTGSGNGGGNGGGNGK